MTNSLINFGRFLHKKRYITFVAKYTTKRKKRIYGDDDLNLKSTALLTKKKIKICEQKTIKLIGIGYISKTILPYDCVTLPLYDIIILFCPFAQVI